MWNRRRGHKFNAIKVEIDGIKFDSKAEARRYQDLKLMPQVSNLRAHPRFPVFVQGVQVCTVVLDFAYRDSLDRWHYEDVKGADTPISRLKRKMVEAEYSIKVEVIR